MNDLIEEIKACRKHLETIDDRIRELRAKMYTVNSSWDTRDRVRSGGHGSRIERLAEDLDGLQKQHNRAQERLDRLTWEFIDVVSECTVNCRNSEIGDALILRVCDGLTAKEVGWKLRITAKQANRLIAAGMNYYRRWKQKEGLDFDGE